MHSEILTIRFVRQYYRRTDLATDRPTIIIIITTAIAGKQVHIADVDVVRRPSLLLPFVAHVAVKY